VRIVSRYLLRQFLSASALVLAGFFVTWLTAELVLHLDEFRSDPGGALRLTLFRTLEIIPLGLPLACLTGAVWSLSRATRFLELTAIRCGGIPLRQVLAPILMAALLLGGAVALFEDRILIPVRQFLPQIEEAEGSTDQRSTLFSNGRWWVAQGSSIFSAKGFDPRAVRLEQVTVFELDDQRRTVRRIDAEEARFLHDQIWELRKARILEFEGGAAPVMRDEARVQLALGVSESQLGRAIPSPDRFTVHSLARWIREWSGSAQGLVPFQAEFHARIARPLAVLVLVLFSVSLSVTEAERRDTLGRALLRSLIAAILYWTAWTAALVLSGSGRVPPALPIWGATALFLALGAFRYRRIPE
jgi:lipopolysaccharide export system permease protein